MDVYSSDWRQPLYWQPLQLAHGICSSFLKLKTGEPENKVPYFFSNRVP